MTRFNQLTDEQDEILTIMMEECAEVIQAIAKIKRHGYFSHHPDRTETNHDQLVRELGDLRCIKQIWKESQLGTKFIIEGRIEAHALEKLQNLRIYTHHIDWDKY